MEWIFVFLLSVFGFGVARAIKLYSITRDLQSYGENLKFPLLGLTATFLVGGVLHRYAGMPAPSDKWFTWLIIIGPFLLVLLLGNETNLDL